jgi:hypothetical protein
MTFYLYYQLEPSTTWVPALADERASIIRSQNPALTTVLDLDQMVDDENPSTTPIRYKGPLYWDIDSADLSTAIEQAKKLLTLLKAVPINLDLNMLQIYLSGKKGLHIMMDSAIFMSKIPHKGTLNLPSIYKEMVWKSLYVDDVDMRVYSARRGRMLRCVNYQREDGAFKVSISADELFSLDEARYKELCAAPRSLAYVEPPKINPALALAFSGASDKVHSSVIQKKSKKTSAEVLQRFNGNWPVTLQKILAGSDLKEGVGFNTIALQVAITGLALGKSQETVVDDAEGLIQAHVGNSTRYNTPSKRSYALKTLLEYVDGNPLYAYSEGGLLALLTPEGKKQSDLKPKGEYVEPETSKALPEEEGGAYKLDALGIYCKADEGFKKVCELGLTEPTVMRKMNGDYIGFEVETHLSGKVVGRKHLPISAFASKSTFNSWVLNQGTAMTASDTQTSNLINLLRKRSEAGGGAVYALEREGIDVIVPPGCENKEGIDIVWAAPDGVVSNGSTRYRFHGVHSAEGYSNTDMMTAPDMALSDAAFIKDLLSINTDKNLSKMLGWFCAAFLTQLIRKELKQFPLLQIFGQAESGKSASVELFNGLNYYLRKPRQLSASGQTLFPIIVAIATSASIPVVFDEMKPRQMDKKNKDQIQNIFRSSYRADIISRGSLGRDKANKEATVTDYAVSAPIAFMGEGIEDQAAILGRCVVVSLSQEDRRGRSLPFNRCVAEATTMGKIGKALATAALAMSCEAVAETVRGFHKEVNKELSEEMQNSSMRATFNLAVAATGITFLQSTLKTTFGDTFDERLTELKDALLSDVMGSIPRNMSESSRVLDIMGMLSRNPDEKYRLVQSQDYTFGDGGKTLDIKLRTAYAKYVKFQRDLGMEVMFDSETAFISGMKNYGGTLKNACPDNSLLWDNPRAVVFRFNVNYLDKELVTSFK